MNLRLSNYGHRYASEIFQTGNIDLSALDPALRLMLDLWTGILVSDQEQPELLELERRGFIERVPETVIQAETELRYRRNPLEHVSKIIFELTTRCNFNCQHCYNATLPRVTETNLAVLKNAVDVFRAIGIERFDFIGGEVTKYGRGWLGLAQYCRRQGANIVTIYTNGWWLEQTNLADVENVCNKLHQLVPGVGNNINPHDLVRWQLFFTLLRSTLNSLATKSSADLLRSLSREGNQSDEALIAQIESMSDPEEKVKAIGGLAEQRPRLITQLSKISQAIPSDYWQSRALTVLISISIHRSPEICIELLRAMRNENQKFFLFHILARELPKEYHPHLLTVLDSFREMEERNSALLVSSLFLKGQGVVQAMPLALQIEEERHRASTLSVLTPNLPVEYLDEVLQAARRITDPGMRASLISSLAERYTGAPRRMLVLETLEAINQIADLETRTSMLTHVEKLLVATEPTALDLAFPPDQGDGRVTEAFAESTVLAMQAATQVEENKERARALANASLLVKKMEDQQTIREESLHCAYEIQDPAERARTLAALARSTQDDWGYQAAEGALAATGEIAAETARSKVLEEVFQALKGPFYSPLCMQIAAQHPDRLKLLKEIASDLPENRIQAGFETLFTTKRWMANEDGQAVLKAIVEKLPGTQIDRILQWMREHPLFGDEDKVKVLEILAPRLSQTQIRAILDGKYFREYEPDDTRAKIVLTILPYVKKESRGAVAEQVLSWVRGMSMRDNDRSSLISRVIAFIPEDKRQQTLQEAVESSQAIVDNFEIGGLCFALARVLLKSGQWQRAWRIIKAAWHVPGRTLYAQSEGLFDRILADLIGIIALLLPSPKKILLHLPNCVPAVSRAKLLRPFDKLRQEIIFRLGYWGAAREYHLSKDIIAELEIDPTGYILRNFVKLLPSRYFPDAAAMLPRIADAPSRESVLTLMVSRVPFSELKGLMPWITQYSQEGEEDSVSNSLYMRIMSVTILLPSGLLDHCLQPEDAQVARKIVEQMPYFEEILAQSDDHRPPAEAAGQLLDHILRVVKESDNSVGGTMLQMLQPVLSQREHFEKALEICHSIQEREMQFETVMALLPDIPEDLLPSYIRLVFPSRNDEDEKENLARLATRVSLLPFKTRWECWRVIVEIFSDMPRFLLAEHLTNLLSLVSVMGGKGTIFFTGQAALHIIRWWP